MSSGVRIITWAICFLALPFLIAPSNTSALQNAPLILEEIDVFGDGDFLLVPLTLLGNKHLFVLDTGSDCSVYDVSLPLGPLRDTAKANTPDGQVDMKLFAAPKTMLGNTPLRGNDLVASTDFSLMRETQGHDIYGLIGMDVLRRHVVRIDFDQGKLFLQRSVGPDAGTPTPLIFPQSSALPHLAIGLPNGEQRLFRVDTGMLASGAIRKDVVADLQRRQRATHWHEAHATALSGTSTRSVWRVEDIRLLNWKHNLFLREGNAESLGLDYLSRYNVTFDFPNGMAYFKESRRHGHETKFNRTGIVLSRKDGRTLVHSAVRQSKAEQAGIRGGDEIVRIGNQDTERVRLKYLDDLLAAEEKALPIVVSRNGRRIEFALSPR